jgi:hypothetical protein
MHYLNFLKADVNSSHHSAGLAETLKVSISLLPESKNLPKILKEYLMNGTFN